MDIRERIEAIRIYSGKTLNAFAKDCGISQPTLDKQLKGLRSISLDTVMAVILSFPDVSSEWLIRGVGPMLITKEKENPELERINKLVDTITTLQDTINAKNETISMLTNRVKQLENQLGK